MNQIAIPLNSICHSKAVPPDRRGRAALEVFRFLKIIGILQFYWKPLRQVNRRVMQLKKQKGEKHEQSSDSI